MAATAALTRLFAEGTDSAGPVVSSMDRLERIADRLAEIRAAAPTDTYRTDADSTLEWNTPAMDAAPVGMAISGPAYEDNPIAYVNDQFEAITGYKESELIGRNLRLLQGPETASEPLADLREALDIWAPVIVELKNYRTNGSPFWNHLALAPIVDETGTVSNWVGIQEPIDRPSKETTR